MSKTVLIIRDRDDSVRANITGDGQVYDSNDKLKGSIDFTGLVAKDADNQLLGGVIGDYLYDAKEHCVASFDAGRAIFKDGGGAVKAEFRKDGTIVGNLGSKVGSLENGSFADIKTLALYIFFLDLDFVNELR